MKPREVIEALQADEAKRARAKATMQVPVDALQIKQPPRIEDDLRRHAHDLRLWLVLLVVGAALIFVISAI